MINLQQILSNIDLQADWIGLRYISEKSQKHYFRNAQPQNHQKKINQGVMVEVLAEGNIGYCATNRLDFIGIQEASKNALAQALSARHRGIFPFTTAMRPPNQGKYQSSAPRTLLSIQEINDFLQEICVHLKINENIVQTHAMAQISDVEQHFISSNGADIYQQFNYIISDYSAVAMAGNIIQKRSDNGMLARSYQGSEDFFDVDSTLNRAQNIGRQALELLTAPPCPDTITTLVVAPDQMMLQIHESVGHPLEIDRILGDERNYAGSSFVKLADFGTLAYGSKLMNITFDPTVTGEIASYGYDDVGIKAEKEYLIKDGILLRGLGSQESQIRAGVKGVANGRCCSWNRPPIDRMANINLEAGNQSFDQIISNIESGIYMESNRSWSIDDYRNKFQFGCEYARLIENGQLTKTVANPNYRGVTQSFWHNLIAVGDESTTEMYGTPICGKGEPNQMIRVGHVSPVCVFDQVQVFGA